MCELEVLLVNSVLVSGHLGCISRDLMWTHTHAPFENDRSSGGGGGDKS